MYILDLHLFLFVIILLLLFGMTVIICKKKKTKYRRFFYFLIEIYCLLMVKVVVMPIVLLNAVSRHDFIKHLGRKVIYGIQTIPFQTIKSNLTPITFAGIIQIFGNIILLMPVAIIIVWIIEEKNKIFILSLGLFVSIIVEGMQYIINALTLYPSHEVDVDDLILNYLGYILMIGVIYIIKKRNINVYNKVRKMFMINE